jgi:DNA mismatch repair protein MutS
MGDDGLTPMIRQYLRIKEQYNDAILFYRIGDFYEMFFEDAEIASKLLNITLTSRNKNEPNPVPLCGVPYHSVEPYIAKLISCGKKVAICDQVEDPKTAKGVVKREVIRVVTPGIILAPESIEKTSHNYVAAAAFSPPPRPSTIKGEGAQTGYGLALADVSTGHFYASQYDTLDLLLEEIVRLEPREILVPRQLFSDSKFRSKISRPYFEPLFTSFNEEKFDPQAITGLEGASSLIKSHPAAARAAAAIWLYIGETQKGEARHIKRIETMSAAKTMRIDEAAKRNLELFKTMIDGKMEGSLFSIIDKTMTSMGARKLKEWMLYPLMDAEKINGRLGAVEHILKTNLLHEIREHLKGVCDLERICARIAMGTASARDLAALKNSLQKIPLIINALTARALPFGSRPLILSKAEGRRTPAQDERTMPRNDGLLEKLMNELDPLQDIREEIEKTIVDEPPMGVREGGLIKEGVDAELDELRSIAGGGKDSIARIEARERARTGISSLKVKYNRVFGYYIEITNTHKDKIPEDYIRKQTLVNAERYITPELKEYEEKVLSAEDKIRALEYDIFCRLREKTALQSQRISATADALATLDVLASFAAAASEYKYTKPVVNEGSEIKITEGRHPIIERLNPIERFVPNDVYVNCDTHRLLIITGPNMAGKSTVMRQTALIVLMAQMGSFIPAKDAVIGIVDRIFTRIGASDALAQGQSTFMVEMREASTILNQATPKSLVIIDEIGRGTSTFDGLSLAWAIAEDLHDRVRARTLFATHYHELTDLASTKEGIKNFNIAVKEWKNQIIFLRKLVPGGTSRSYGIAVAKLAGLPQTVILRSSEVLKNLEAGEFDEIGKPRIAMHSGEKSENTGQMNLFCKP